MTESEVTEVAGPNPPDSQAPSSRCDALRCSSARWIAASTAGAAGRLGASARGAWARTAAVPARPRNAARASATLGLGACRCGRLMVNPSIAGRRVISATRPACPRRRRRSRGSRAGSVARSRPGIGRARTGGSRCGGGPAARPSCGRSRGGSASLSSARSVSAAWPGCVFASVGGPWGGCGDRPFGSSDSSASGLRKAGGLGDRLGGLRGGHQVAGRLAASTPGPRAGQGRPGRRRGPGRAGSRPGRPPRGPRRAGDVAPGRVGRRRGRPGQRQPLGAERGGEVLGMLGAALDALRRPAAGRRGHRGPGPAPGARPPGPWPAAASVRSWYAAW